MFSRVVLSLISYFVLEHISQEIQEISDEIIKHKPDKLNTTHISNQGAQLEAQLHILKNMLEIITADTNNLLLVFYTTLNNVEVIWDNYILPRVRVAREKYQSKTSVRNLMHALLRGETSSNRIQYLANGDIIAQIVDTLVQIYSINPNIFVRVIRCKYHSTESKLARLAYGASIRGLMEKLGSPRDFTTKDMNKLADESHKNTNVISLFK